MSSKTTANTIDHQRCEWRADADRHGWTCTECGRAIVSPDRNSMVARGLSQTTRRPRQPGTNAARSEEYRQHLRSPAWKRLRAAKIAAAGGTCEKCGTDLDLEVHHLTYDNLGHEPLEDLMVLCPACHELADQARQDDTRRRTWDRRLDGWATRRYGEDWWDRHDEDAVAQEFETWLDEQT